MGGGFGGGYGGGPGAGGDGGFGPFLPGDIQTSSDGRFYMVNGVAYENPSPSHTIEQLPNDLRQLLLDWAHEQDKVRNDGKACLWAMTLRICMSIDAVGICVIDTDAWHARHDSAETNHF